MHVEQAVPIVIYPAAHAAQTLAEVHEEQLAMQA